jgi:RHS repeat-associated protein
MITENIPSYSWNAVSNSSWYYLWVNDSTGNVIKQWYTAQQAGCEGGTGLCTVTHTTALAEGSGQWWIQTWNNTKTGPWSTRKRFEIDTVSTSGVIDYIYDQQGLLISEISQGNTKETIYLNGQPLARINNNQVYYYHNDHLGTPQVMTDQNQAVVWQADYDPFGKATVTTETITNPIRVPGQYFDAETGLHYNYYRYYDPGTGRYITSDPIGLLGGLNTYAYVKNNP